MPKIAANADRSWVKALPAHAILEILDVMHDMLGAPLRAALEAERWLRLSAPLTEWPVIEREVTPGVTLRFVYFCNHYDHVGDGDAAHAAYVARRPDDPDHRPARAMFVDGKPVEFECSCGRRARVYMGKREVVGRWWWPKTRFDWEGEPLRVPHFVVPPCVMNGVDDPRRRQLGLPGSPVVHLRIASAPR